MDNVLVLNESFELVAIIDYYKSLIWTERYREAGDFELYLLADTTAIGSIEEGYYLQIQGSNMTMIVEQFEITTNTEEGNALIITGRSLESILDRRIVWPQTTLSGNLQNGVKTLITEALIRPVSDPSRKIPGFTFEDSTDPLVTNLTLEAQYTGDNLYDVIISICETYNLGFRITLEENPEVTVDNPGPYIFKFSLYAGVDRSYDQSVNEYVIFSSKFGNLISSNYLETQKPLKTIAYIAGEGEGAERKSEVTTILDGGEEVIGIKRRELFVDARDISSTVYDDQGGSTTITDEEYSNLLIERGKEKLSENVITRTFEGEVENGMTFSYGTHFFMGDIVQIVNEYGLEGTSRVIEFVRSISPSGIEYYPTFEAIQEA